MKPPPGVILAGGLSRRMGGGDKGLLTLGGTTLLNRVIDRIAPQVTDLALNANGNPDRFGMLGLPVLPDPVPGFPGPLAGVLAGLDWAAGLGAETVVTVAADTPFFPQDLVSGLVRESRGMAHPLVLAATLDRANKRSRHPTFGLWPVALRDDLRNTLATGLRKVVLWTDRHGGREALFSPNGTEPFFNVNTPGDLAVAEEMVAQ